MFDAPTPSSSPGGGRTGLHKLFVCHTSPPPPAAATLQAQVPLREHRGPLGADKSFQDCVLDLKSIDLPFKMMVGCSRSGEIKLWR